VIGDRLNFRDFEGIDWDSDEDEVGNLAHCLRPDHLGPEPERIVDEVLSEQPVEIKYKVKTAELAIVGPDRSRSRLWVILFDVSHKRGDWLRPVTGWQAEPAERAKWEQRYGKLEN
jgi:hypothetical protein